MKRFVKRVCGLPVLDDSKCIDRTAALINALDKLYKIEELEKQIGIDLVTLFNLIGRYIYIFDGAEVCRFPLIAIDNKFVYIQSAVELTPIAMIKNLNKTWFLTKEEAEQALKEMEKE